MSDGRRKRGGNIILAVDVLAAGLYVYFLPALRRPVDILAILMVVLGLATAVFASRELFRNLALGVIALGVSLFVLDMSPKFINIEALLDKNARDLVIGEGGGFDWELHKPTDYLARLEQADEALEDDMPTLQVLAEGESPQSTIFDGIDTSRIQTRVTHPTGRTQTLNSLKPYYMEREPLGYEMTPDNLVHEYAVEDSTRTVLYNTSVTVNSHGLRETRGNRESSETYLFMGCSFTFGAGLDDDETSAYYFSRAAGFEKNVLNLGVNGYGHHQALRDLEVNRSLGKVGIDPSTVKGVVLQYFDGHNLRAVDPVRMLAPRYALENGRAVFKGPFSDSGRLFLFLERSRLYPILRERLFSRMNSVFQADSMDLGMAIIAEMNRICRERYGAPLTVLYWLDNPATIDRIRRTGAEVITVSEIIGEGWRKLAVKYLQFDNHPNAECTRLVGEGLYARLAGGGKNSGE